MSNRPGGGAVARAAEEAAPDSNHGPPAADGSNPGGGAVPAVSKGSGQPAAAVRKQGHSFQGGVGPPLDGVGPPVSARRTCSCRGGGASAAEALQLYCAGIGGTGVLTVCLMSGFRIK